MHAVLSNVSIPSGQFETARKMLNDEVVPRIKKASGAKLTVPVPLRHCFSLIAETRNSI
jgi:hypothetical protein